MQQNEKFPRRLAAIPRQQTLFERYSGLPDLSRLGLIGDAVNEALKEVQAPPPLTLLVCLVAASTATQSLYDVERPAGGQTSLSLYGLLIADSGERKSSLINYFFKPIQEAEIAAEKEHQKRILQWQRDFQIWEIHRKELKKRLSKAIERDIVLAMNEENTDD
ncbi:DUF3987 domain-containing protein [Marinobacter nauticus]|uniref:DUF3987 domain-containing protein n=1 Tax=Marinobacter nauticus TaxID=2743 RepID=UPI001C9A1A56|nr:DUF3987 domain-containing protein [Marinobacter nauticus]MBY5938091.1 DUF3987 domain-containing protein [Marinobacter nauticus]MBY5955320.1 DUF3987 domain-containing protein [Marinobacter nauticus]MBY6009111.1 DUF3987 domain-containing protein [Marinobacter nauticus]